MAPSSYPHRGPRTARPSHVLASGPYTPAAYGADGEPAVYRPDRWAGEVDCRVGPFLSVSDAERFSNHLVDFGRFETIKERVLVEDANVFVEMTRL